MKTFKLTNKEAQDVADLYDLGKVKSFELFSGGLVNYNYGLKTNKGSYVLRIIGHKVNEQKMQKLLLEKDVLLFLKESKFPYEIPVPLISKKGEYHSKFKGTILWVYRMLDGHHIKSYNEPKVIKEVAKAIAIYHKHIKKFKTTKFNKYDFNLDWLSHKYSEIGDRLNNLKRLNNLDKLVKENYKLFNEMLGNIKRINFKVEVIIAHGDINQDNTLFNEDKLTGILDFDNLKFAPKSEDIAYALRLLCPSSTDGVNKKSMNLFLKEYRKIMPLSKKEEKLLIPLMIRGTILVLWWMYMEMEKGQDKKYKMIEWNIMQTKNLAKQIGWLK